MIREYRCNARNDCDEDEVTVYAANAKDALKARSLSDFLVHTATEAAVKTIATHEEIILSEQEREAFFNALLNPIAPSHKAIEAAQRYRRTLQQSG